MHEVSGWIRGKVRNTAKKAVKYSVGKSYLPFGYEKEYSEAVEKWVVDQRKKR